MARRVDGDLRDEAQPLARGDGDLAPVVVQLPGEDFEQSGLARPVLAQKAHPLPGVHLEGEAVQYFVANLKLFPEA